MSIQSSTSSIPTSYTTAPSTTSTSTLSPSISPFPSPSSSVSATTTPAKTTSANTTPAKTTPETTTPATTTPATTTPATTTPAATTPAATTPSTSFPPELNTNPPSLLSEKSISNLGNINIMSTSLGNFIILFIMIILVISIFMKIIGIFSGSSSNVPLPAMILDIVGLLFIGGMITYSFFFVSSEQQVTNLKEYINQFSSLVSDPMSILYSGIFILVFYVSVFILGIPMSSDMKPFMVGIIDSVAWLVLITSSIVTFIAYTFNINIMNIASNYINQFIDYLSGIEKSPLPSLTKDNTVVADVKHAVDTPGEVFNIKNNLYTYEDAQAVCQAYGARLATYDDIENSYNKGGEWCNYGWSEGQMAYFPTQKSTWLELQKSDKTKNKCGRPGINGGYMANPYLRFGINCFGKKPDATDEDKRLMQQGAVVPTTPEDQKLNEKVEFWKENKEKILKLNSFNNNKWSQY